jgi:DNA-binding NarL/FixJ family response regulator
MSRRGGAAQKRPPARAEEFVRAVANGRSVPDIARRAGVRASTVSATCHDYAARVRLASSLYDEALWRRMDHPISQER